MTSKREQVISSLHNKLKILESATISIYRNPDKPQKIPAGGIIILRDGGGEEPEVLLSPLTYIYEHSISIEVMINNAYADRQGTTLDDLLMIIENLILNNRSMNGLAEWMEAQAPEFLQEAVDGAPAIRAATITVLARFSTNSPLH